MPTYKVKYQLSGWLPHPIDIEHVEADDPMAARETIQNKFTPDCGFLDIISIDLEADEDGITDNP